MRIEKHSGHLLERRGVSLPRVGLVSLTVMDDGGMWVGLVTVGRHIRVIGHKRLERVWLWLYDHWHSHAHRCGDCGTIWRHSDAKRGNIAAHECPKCGELEWRQHTE